MSNNFKIKNGLEVANGLEIKGGGLIVSGITSIYSDLQVSGNIAYTGQATIIQATPIAVDQPLIYLADGNTADILDQGVIGKYNTTKYSGLVRDASDTGTWKLFSNLLTTPGNTVDFSTVTYDNLKIGALNATTGTFAGGVSGTTGTFNGNLSAISGSFGGTVIAPNFVSTAITGTAPFTVASATPVSGLNIDGYSNALKTATGSVVVGSATAPTSGQVLTATSNTTAAWTSLPSSDLNTATGVLPVSHGGTGVTSSSGTGSVVLNTSPSIATSLTTNSTSFDLVNTTATAVNIAGAATNLHIGSGSGTTIINNNLQVAGTITYSGTANQLSPTNLSVSDSLIFMSDGNTADMLDIGILGHYYTSKYSGFVRDASDNGSWKLVSNITNTPGVTVDFTGSVYDNLYIGNLHSNQVISTVATGTAPLVVTSATPVSGLNIDGYSTSLKTATGSVVVGSATAPTAGQVLTASSATSAVWVTPAGGDLTTMTGILPVSKGGTNTTTSTGTGSVVLNTDPLLSSPIVELGLTTESTSFNLVNANATTVNFAGAATTLNLGATTGTTTINNSLQVAGNITFGAGATQLSATVINVEDPLLYLGDNNPADINDLGLIAAYNNGVHTHSGIVRDATDKVWKLFSGVSTEPSNNVVDFTNAVYDDLKIGGLYATEINKLILTQPETSAVLTLDNDSTLATSGAYSITLTATADSIVTLPTSGTLVSSDTTSLPNLSSVGTVATGTWSASFGAVSGANLTNLSAGNLSGTIPSAVLENSSVYIGTTAVTLNRASSAVTLSGVSIDGAAGALATTGSPVVVSGSSAPTTNQVLAATSETEATWRNISDILGGSAGTVTSVDGQGTVNGITLTGSVATSGYLTLGGTLSGINLTTQVTGTLPVSNGGTGSTTSTGTGSVVLATSPDIGTSLTTASTSFDLVNTNATTVNFAGAATTLGIGGSTGNTTVNNNLVVAGNFTVNGTNNIINTNSINVADSTISMASGNTLNSVDIGIYGLHDSSTTSKYTGFIRDASDGNTWKLFDDITALPGTTVDFTTATYAPIKVGDITSGKINKVTVTDPGTGATLSLANNSVLTTAANFTTAGQFPLTLTATAATNVTLPTTGTLLSSTSTAFNNVTLTAPTTGATITLADNSVLTTAGNFTTSGGHALTLTTTGATSVILPTSGTLLSTSSTAFNKVTITAPTTGATLTLANNSSLVTSGAFSTTLTTTANTNVTLPTSGTLVADGYTTTATAAGTTTLTDSSTSMQVFTGTSAQTVKLPDTSKFSVGKRFTITNNSTGLLTIQTSAAGAVTTQPAGTIATYTVAATNTQTWVSAISPLLVTVNTVVNTISDGSGNLRSIPQSSKSAAYTLVAADNGKNINITTGGITIPSNVFAAGDVVSIYNQSSFAQNIAWSGPTVYLAGTSTAKTSPLSLAARGILTIMFATTSEIVVSGNV